MAEVALSASRSGSGGGEVGGSGFERPGVWLGSSSSALPRGVSVLLNRRSSLTPKARVAALAARIVGGEPLAYVTGWTGFRHLALRRIDAR